MRQRQSSFRIRLAHSTLPHKDMVLEAVPGPGGRFSARLPVLEKARWRVVVEEPANDWRLAGSWQWPQQALANRWRSDEVGAVTGRGR